MGGHIVLLGEMGAGKTTVGKALAALLGRDLADSDLAIEARLGSTGAVIAAEHGVALLHRLEREALLEALDSDLPLVVAAAASVVDLPATRDRLTGETCVWLTAQPETITARVGGASHRRSIGAEERQAITARRDHYRELAAIQVDTTFADPDETAEAIVSRLGISAVG